MALTELFTGIADAIRSKKGTSNAIPAVNFPSEIEGIPTGGGGGDDGGDKPIKVTFLYRDTVTGKEKTVVKSYDAGENAVFPADVGDVQANTGKNPALTFQGWNFTQADLNNLLGDVVVGATYIPTDGKTHAYITITPITTSIVTLYFNKSDTSTLTIDWGDGTQNTDTASGNRSLSHEYANFGDYEIALWISAGTGNYSLGNSSNSAAFIGGNVQSQLNALTTVFIGKYVASAADYTFYGCFSLKSVTIPSGVTFFGSYAFYNCRSLKSISTPNSVTSIGSYAFYGCFSLKSISTPNSVTTIGSYLFYNCYNLTNFPLPNNNASFQIQASTFYNCFSLTSMVIPNSVTSIGASVFNSCYSLTSMVIPNSVTSIGTQALSSCYGLTSYKILRTTPPTLGSSTSFNNINSIAKIYVPDESVDAYKTATNWNSYANYIYPLSEAG